MATEIAQGGQAALDAFTRMRDSSLPIDDRYDADFTDHDPADGKASDRWGSTDELGIRQQLGLA